MANRSWVLILFLAVIVGCKTEGVTHVLGEKEVISVRNANDSAIELDLNQNGIRDDVERYIDSLDITPKQKEALRFKAKTLQDTLTVDLNDEQALRKVSQDNAASVNCVDSNFKNFDEVLAFGNAIRSKTMNTRARIKRYADYNHAVSGSTTRFPSGDTCEKH